MAKAQPSKRPAKGAKAPDLSRRLASTIKPTGGPAAQLETIADAAQFIADLEHRWAIEVGQLTRNATEAFVAEARTREARQRLRVLEKSNDGFVIAEADLSLRGPGELLGQEQSGSPSFRFANLAEDALLIEKARDAAKQLLDKTA